MLTKEAVIYNIPLVHITRIKKIIDDIDTNYVSLVDKYNQLKKYDVKLRRSESQAAIEAYNIVDDILMQRYIFSSEVSEWKYECTIRIVMSLMIYGSINITIDELTRDEFIIIRKSLRTWYKQFKRVVK